MFRNAEYRRSLMESLSEEGSAALPPISEAGSSLPPVNGKIKATLIFEFVLILRGC